MRERINKFQYSDKCKSWMIYLLRLIKLMGVGLCSSEHCVVRFQCAKLESGMYRTLSQTNTVYVHYVQISLNT